MNGWSRAFFRFRERDHQKRRKQSQEPNGNYLFHMLPGDMPSAHRPWLSQLDPFVRPRKKPTAENCRRPKLWPSGESSAATYRFETLLLFRRSRCQGHEMARCARMSLRLFAATQTDAGSAPG